ncbi:MAG: dienelactone hydrolase family protein [Oceanospirillaceae bacterium]
MCDDLTCGPNNNLPAIELSEEQRRLFIKGLISLPLATVLGVPGLAMAAAEKLETVHITSETGERLMAALALPENPTNAPAVLLIHEWWGLNDQIKSVAQEFAKQGYIALAVDLYQGGVATTADQARSLMSAVNATHATEALQAWVSYLKDNHKATKVGTIGWCFGGGWSLNASLAANIDATVVYYGDMSKSAAQLSKLKSPLLGHFGTQDQWINQPMLDKFSKALQDSGSKADTQIHWYEANHAFANPSSARYDEQDAALAWQRTLAFFQQHLRS